MKRPAQIMWLAALWMVLWGSATLANLAGGLAVGVVVTYFVAGTGDTVKRRDTTPIRIRPLGALRFLAVSTHMLIASTFDTIAAIVRPSTVRSAVVAVKMRTSDDIVVTAVANTVTLTPGTMTLAVTDDPVSLFIHVLRYSDREAVERDVRRLEVAAASAFGVELAPGRPGAEKSP